MKIVISHVNMANSKKIKNVFNFRFIYNLVSKSKYSDKGDYELLRQSLVAMRDHARENNVKKIGQLKNIFYFLHFVYFKNICDLNYNRSVPFYCTIAVYLIF
jgi:hypothetical protein